MPAQSSSASGGKPEKPKPFKPPVEKLTENIHRTLPHSLEAEQGVLGSMLIDKDAVGPVVESGLTAEMFYQPTHGEIFTAIIERWDKGHEFDMITITQHFRDIKRLAAIGGAAYLSSLIDFTPTSANVAYYADIAREKYVLREMIAKGTAMVLRAYEDGGEPFVLLDESEAALLGIRTQMTPATAESTIKEHVMEAIENLEKLYQNKGALIGLETGLKGLDNLTAGLRPTDMIVIAARPSMGKTAICLNIAEFVAITLNQPVGIFSLEMSTGQLVQRMLCSRARVSIQKVRHGGIGEADFPNLTVAAGKIAQAPLFIDDTSGISITELRAKARRWHKEHGLKLIVIDYLQLMRSTTKRAADNRQLEVAEISSGIKALAKELKIPIIVAAQLNRKPDDRASGKPRLSDLRESGAIEQDADVVGLLVRAEYYAEDDEQKEEVRGEAELIIAKQRNGPVDTVPLTYIKEWTRFEDRAWTPEK